MSETNARNSGVFIARCRSLVRYFKEEFNLGNRGRTVANGKLTFEQLSLMTKTLGAVLLMVLGAYGWMFATFVSAADYEDHVATYELDRVGDKIEELDTLIFNINELIRDENTSERRLQLKKYQGSLEIYKRQQTCYLENKNNCRKIG